MSVDVLMVAVPVLLAAGLYWYVRALKAAHRATVAEKDRWRARCCELERTTPAEVRLGALLRQAREERDEARADHEALRASLHDRYQARREEREMTG